MFCCVFYGISKNTFFTENLWTTASEFMKYSYLNTLAGQETTNIQLC